MALSPLRWRGGSIRYGYVFHSLTRTLRYRIARGLDARLPAAQRPPRRNPEPAGAVVAVANAGRRSDAGPAVHGVSAGARSDRRLGHARSDDVPGADAGTKRRECPVAMYFHENQLSYPPGPRQKHDLGLSFINYASALAADAVFFNSAYHQSAFLDELPRLLKHYPDYNELHTVGLIHDKARVLPLGLDLRRLDAYQPARFILVGRRTFRWGVGQKRLDLWWSNHWRPARRRLRTFGRLGRASKRGRRYWWGTGRLRLSDGLYSNRHTGRGFPGLTLTVPRTHVRILFLGFPS